MTRKAIGAAVAMLAAGCGGQPESRIDAGDVRPLDTEPWQVPREAAVSADTTDFAAFGVALFRQMADAAPDSNVVVSPVSAGLALGMLVNGAEGGTRDGILRALAAGGMDVAALDAANAALVDALRTDSVELAIANSLWAQEGMAFAPAFLERNRRFYDAEVATVDFGDPATAARINRWASDHTNGRITRMLEPPLDPALVLYLMNAVYFKGRWVDEFAERATRPMPFHAPGGTVQRPMMHRTGDYGYREGDGFRAVRLPYRGGRFAMYVLLPDSGASLTALRERMTGDAWAEWMRGYQVREVALAMPSYRMSVAMDLKPPLAALGMEEAFDPARANLRAMFAPGALGNGNAFVSEAKQKVFIEVDEEGTEAAAVTGIGVGVTSMPPPPVPFTVDRPFLLAIRDDRTGALLFVGQVVDPVTED